jgi:hypothetical protein
MKLSTIVKGGICVLGLVGVGSIFAAPASAGQATARGAATVVRASGASVSVSGELTAPNGYMFPGALVVTPTYGGTAVADDETVATLTVTGGTPTAFATATSGNPFLDEAAAQLKAAANVVEAATIIRAGAGANGLGGLE